MSTKFTAQQQGKIKQLALSKVGFPYKLGTAGPNIFDCSGLVQWVYGQVGFSWKWSVKGATGGRSSQMSQNCYALNWNDMEIGDLVFRFDTGIAKRNHNSVTHVMIYVGDGNLVEAVNQRQGVIKTKIKSYQNDGKHLPMRPKDIHSGRVPHTEQSESPHYYNMDFSTDKYSTKNPLVPLHKPTEVPPSYYEDVLPAHRTPQGKYFLRIGDCQFFVPPLFISVTNPSASEKVPTIRQKESVQKNHGYSAREIEISLYFNGIEHINGVEMESGLSCGNYYMDGLRALVAQFKKLPFLPIVNEFLNETNMIYAATLVNISFSTVPRFPGTLQAKLILKEFNAAPYLGVPTTCYDTMICWPLFRWYYQQQLVDGPTYANQKLPKVVTNDFSGSVKFKLLPEAYLQNAISSVDLEQNKHNQFSYIANEWAFMEEVELDYENMSVSSIMVTLGNIVTDLQLAAHQTPTHQFIGSLDTMFTISITTKSRKLINQLTQLHNTVQRYVLDYKNKIATGYLGIENELINMMGVTTATLQHMTVSTVEGNPELTQISMDFLSYNKTQLDDGMPRGFTPHAVLDENIGVVGKGIDAYQKPIIWDCMLEDMANEVEVYPDLNLPSYTEVNNVIVEINKYRASKGLKELGVNFLISPMQNRESYVDPDFFVFYPSPVQLGLIDIESFNRYWEAYDNGGTSGMLDQSLKGKSGVDLLNNVMQLMTDCKKYTKEFTVPATNALNEKTQGMPSVAEEEMYKFMLHDMFKYNNRYTLCRAFPTAMFFFMDEGPRVRGIRLLNNMYAYNALISVDVYRDRDNPIDVCELVLSNIYHSLSTLPSYYNPEKKSWMGTIFIDPDQEMIDQRKKLFKFMNLEAGCRVHVRMGYGSVPQNLPTVFNGIVTEIDSGPIMRVMCQSDGHELTNPIQSGEETVNSFFNKGSEPSDIIANIMTDRAGWQATYTWTNWMSEIGKFCNESKYGIEHFGNIFTSEDILADFRALFHIGDEGKMSYDVLKNVYKGLPYVAPNGPYARTTNKKWSIKQPTDEENINMYLFGKAPWDIFKTLCAASTEYIVTATPHNFRSTLFFGQPTWLYKYGYKYNGGANIADREKLENYSEKIKTYSQLHCIDSMCDIIDNGTTASSSNLITAVIPTYVEGETVKSDFVVYADKNIYPEHQKTAYYDTTIMQDYLFWEVAITAVGINIAERRARSSAISYLQHSFKDMYKGQIVIVGDATIKPYDTLNIHDTFREMYGMSYVGSVTHSLSVNDGFVTSIKPDLISLSQKQESIGVARVLSQASLFANNFMFARNSLIGTQSIIKSLELYGERSAIKDKNELLRTLISLSGGASAGAIAAISFGAAGVSLAVCAGWYLVDRCIEWYEKVFGGRDNHTISIMPLMVKDRPFVAGIKGHQTLIPGYSDEVQDRGAKYGLDTTQEAARYIAEKDREDYNEIISGVQQRATTGVNIFELSGSPYEVYAETNGFLTNHITNAVGLDPISPNTSSPAKGVLPNGTKYVHKFSQAVISTYSDKGGTAGGVTALANGKICASHNIACGTKIYIPDLKYINGNGIFEVQDTGGPTFDFDINIAGVSLKGAYDVYVLEWGNGRMMQSFESAIGQQVMYKKRAEKNNDHKKAARHQSIINLHYSDKNKYNGGYKLLNFVQPGRKKKTLWDMNGNYI